jgi:hypothetical protein
MQSISRDGLLDNGAVTLVEALPAAHNEAEHLPGAMKSPRSIGRSPT